MSFVIFNPANGLYFRQPLGKPHSWVKDPNRALQFGKQQRAKNFLSNNFEHIVHDFKPEDMQLIDRKAQAQPAPASVPPHIAGEADAQELVAALPQMVEELTQSANVVRAMERFYAAQQKTADLESLDLLHKIEFTELDVISGFLLCHQLQEVRLRRRRAKDSLELLCLFRESGLLESLGKLQVMIGAYRERIDTRSYLPRVLDELFEAFPKTLEPPTDPLAAAGAAPNETTAAGAVEPATDAPTGTDSAEAVKPAPDGADSAEAVKPAPDGADSAEEIKAAPVDSGSTEPANAVPVDTDSTELVKSVPVDTDSTELVKSVPADTDSTEPAKPTSVEPAEPAPEADAETSLPGSPPSEELPPETIALPRRRFKRRVVNSRAWSHLEPERRRSVGRRPKKSGRRRPASRRPKKPGRRQPVSRKPKKHVRRIPPRV